MHNIIFKNHRLIISIDTIALGRPVAINDEDITIPYPESMGPEMSGQPGSQEAKTVIGVVAHIK